MNIEFLNNTFGKYLKLTQNGNTFNILFGGNLDLYFQPVMNRMELFTSDEHLEFKISKEDRFLYEAFMHLYEKIINYIPLEEMDSKREREYQKLKDSYRPFPLVHDKVISWHSDEEDVDTSSILNISKTEDNQIKLEFIKNKPEGQHLHFHCDAGEGRTTTFMVLYQIMTDNGNLSLDQILCYQYNMGGITLTDDVDRAYFLNAFYNYVEKNKTDNYSIKFSQWIKQ